MDEKKKARAFKWNESLKAELHEKEIPKKNQRSKKQFKEFEAFAVAWH